MGNPTVRVVMKLFHKRLNHQCHSIFYKITLPIVRIKFMETRANSLEICRCIYPNAGTPYANFSAEMPWALGWLPDSLLCFETYSRWKSCGLKPASCHQTLRIRLAIPGLVHIVFRLWIQSAFYSSKGPYVCINHIGKSFAQNRQRL